MATSAAVAAGDVIQATDYNNLRTDVRATHDHEATEGQKLNVANAFDAGVLAHERGGLEFDASAITTNGIFYGTSAGVVGILAGGTALYHLRVNAGATALEWAEASSAVITFEGSDTSEATTTSASPVDLIDVTSISVPAANPFQLFISGRKDDSAGGGEAHFGLKLNATVVGEADNNPVTTPSPIGIWSTENADAVSSGLGFAHIGPRVASYLRGASGFSTADDGGTDNRGYGTSPAHTADMPTVAITSVIIRADNADNFTTGGDELYVLQIGTS